MSHITIAMNDAVGREMWRAVSHPISESDIRRWALAAYYPDAPPRHFLDADVAAKTPRGGIVASEDFNPFAWAVAAESGPDHQVDPDDPDGTERMLGIPGPGLRTQLNGGVETDYGVRMRPGDVVTAVRRLSGYWERPGRLGPMLFCAVEETWTNQHAQVVKTATKTYIRY